MGTEAKNKKTEANRLKTSVEPDITLWRVLEANKIIFYGFIFRYNSTITSRRAQNAHQKYLNGDFTMKKVATVPGYTWYQVK